MIEVTPATIQPNLLPSTGIPPDWKYLHCSCVYFLVAARGRILYVGETSSLAGRFLAHHRMEEVSIIDGATRVHMLAWPLPLPDTIDRFLSILARKDFEADCIFRFDPVLNSHARRRWGDITGLEYARTTPNGNRPIPVRSVDDGARHERARRMLDTERGRKINRPRPSRVTGSEAGKWGARKNRLLALRGAPSSLAPELLYQLPDDLLGLIAVAQTALKEFYVDLNAGLDLSPHRGRLGRIAFKYGLLGGNPSALIFSDPGPRELWHLMVAAGKGNPPT